MWSFDEAMVDNGSQSGTFGKAKPSLSFLLPSTKVPSNIHRKAIQFIKKWLHIYTYVQFELTMHAGMGNLSLALRDALVYGY